MSLKTDSGGISLHKKQTINKLILYGLNKEIMSTLTTCNPQNYKKINPIAMKG